MYFAKDRGQFTDVKTLKWQTSVVNVSKALKGLFVSNGSAHVFPDTYWVVEISMYSPVTRKTNFSTQKYVSSHKFTNAFVPIRYLWVSVIRSLLEDYWSWVSTFGPEIPIKIAKSAPCWTHGASVLQHYLHKEHLTIEMLDFVVLSQGVKWPGREGTLISISCQCYELWYYTSTPHASSWHGVSTGTKFMFT
jgi:hypothetical protein